MHTMMNPNKRGVHVAQMNPGCNLKNSVIMEGYHNSLDAVFAGERRGGGGGRRKRNKKKTKRVPLLVKK